MALQMDEDKMRLCAVDEMSRKLLIDLTNYFVVKQNIKTLQGQIVTSSTPDIALSEVLSSRPQAELNNLQLESNLRSVTSKIFQSKNPLVIANPINITHWDITSLICLLQNISSFHTSKEKLRKQNIACVGNLHERCCSNCQHGSKRSVCSHCKEQHSICYKRSTPCCLKCKTCLYCSSKNSTSCESEKLRYSVETIRKLRNFLAHSVPEDLQNLKAGTFNNTDFPSLTNWNQLWSSCTNEVLVLLDYLYNKGAINNFRYYRFGDDITNNLQTCTTNCMYEEYKSAVESLLVINSNLSTSQGKQFLTFNLDFSLSNLKQTGLLGWIWPNNQYSFTFTDRSPKSALSTALNKCVEEYFCNNHQMNQFNHEDYEIRVKALRLESTCYGFGIIYSCIFDAKNGHEIPLQYKNENTPESDKLWEDLQDVISTIVYETLKVPVLVELAEWTVGSVIVDIILSKKSRAKWEDWEIHMLDAIMDSLVEIVHISDELELVKMTQANCVKCCFELTTYNENIFEVASRLSKNLKHSIIEERSRTAGLATVSSTSEIPLNFTTYLIHAVKSKSCDTVEEILKRMSDADMGFKDKDGNTYLIHALKTRQWNIVEKILERMSEVDMTFEDKDGNTYLIHALKTYSRIIVFNILNLMSDSHMDFLDKDGKTYLHYAVETRNSNIVREIASRMTKTYISLENKDGLTAINMARSNNKEYLVSMIENTVSEKSEPVQHGSLGYLIM